MEILKMKNTIIKVEKLNRLNRIDTLKQKY